MEQILFLAHVESDGSLAKPALEALAAAKTVCDSLPGSSLAAGLIGASVDRAAEQIASCGAQRFLSVAGAEFQDSRYASDTLAYEAIARAAKATIIVASGTSRNNRALPGVAYRLEGRIDSHVTGTTTQDSTLSIKRWYYRQRLEAVITRAQRPWIIVVDPGSGTPWQGASGTAALNPVPVDLPAGGRRTTVTGFESPAGDQQTIRPDAELLLVAGAGWTKKQPDGKVHATEAREQILDFLAKAKASLGGSKSLVDMDNELRQVFNFMSHLNQVGQTGATPRHQKGLSTCCHGEEPHAVGWRFINERRAVNLDPNCGWARGKADVLYVADAFQVMAKVNELLAK